jgi:hypothetical protein
VGRVAARIGRHRFWHHCLFAPDVSFAALVLVFGTYTFVDGIFNIAGAIRRRGATDRWWLLLLEGLVGIAAGVVTLIWPGITALALLYLIAAWALVTGIFEIAAAIRLRKVITGECARAKRDRIHCIGRCAGDFSRPWSAGASALDRRVCLGFRCSADRTQPPASLLGQVSRCSCDPTRRMILRHDQRIIRRFASALECREVIP